MPGERQLKVWMVEEAERFGVAPITVFRWKQRGLFPHLTFTKEPSGIVMVSGEDRPQPPPPIRTGAPRKYDFTGVDWTQPTMDIAREVGCHYTTVVVARRRTR